MLSRWTARMTTLKLLWVTPTFLDQFMVRWMRACWGVLRTLSRIESQWLYHMFRIKALGKEAIGWEIQQLDSLEECQEFLKLEASRKGSSHLWWEDNLWANLGLARVTNLRWAKSYLSQEILTCLLDKQLNLKISIDHSQISLATQKTLLEAHH